MCLEVDGKAIGAWRPASHLINIPGARDGGYAQPFRLSYRWQHAPCFLCLLQVLASVHPQFYSPETGREPVIVDGVCEAKGFIAPSTTGTGQDDLLRLASDCHDRNLRWRFMSTRSELKSVCS
jgi:hypothetical protein